MAGMAGMEGWRGWRKGGRAEWWKGGNGGRDGGRAGGSRAGFGTAASHYAARLLRAISAGSFEGSRRSARCRESGSCPEEKRLGLLLTCELVARWGRGAVGG